MRTLTIDPHTGELRQRRFYCSGCGHEVERNADLWLMTEFEPIGGGAFVCPTIADHKCPGRGGARITNTRRRKPSRQW